MGNYHDKYDAFYQSRAWRALRMYKFSETNGLCEECLKQGKIVAAAEIHHIVPIDTNEGWKRRYDITNLKSLCSACHNKAHSRISPLQKFNDFWEKLNAESAESHN